jgi:Lrp/AsnC family transcriptional regulator, leucine-responsive regulatory protein
VAIMVRSKARPAVAPSNRRSLLDAVNRRILEELAANARISTSELARRVSLSPPSVRERITALTEAGVIRGFALDVDPAAIGLPVAAWVRVRPGPGQLPRIAELADRTPQVSECHRVSGEDCFLMKVHAATIADLEPILDRFLAHGQTTSSFVVSTPVAPRPVLPS